MAKVVITLKIMPKSPEVDLTAIEEKIKEKIKEFVGDTEFRTEIQPIAFGIKALIVRFLMDESKGSTDKLENELKNFDDIQSLEVVDVRRAVG